MAVPHTFHVDFRWRALWKKESITWFLDIIGHHRYNLHYLANRDMVAVAATDRECCYRNKDFYCPWHLSNHNLLQRLSIDGQRQPEIADMELQLKLRGGRPYECTTLERHPWGIPFWATNIHHIDYSDFYRTPVLQKSYDQKRP